MLHLLRSPSWRPLTLLGAAGLLLASSWPMPARAHGAAGAADLAPGTFQIAPVLTLEGHGGLENNLEGRPRHYAIDGLFGVVMEWGLANRGSLAIEAMVGPALVWGEAEHFYGQVHRQEGADHDAHHGSEPSAHHDDHHGSDPEGDHAHEHGGHAGHDHGGAGYRRTDIKGMLQVRYQPNPRLSFLAEWLPYYITRTQDDDTRGLRQEIGVGMALAFGDGDVNVALGDGLETIADGLFLSLENRSGWDSDGTYLGNYTDPWLGLGFSIDRLNVTLSAGPRFYSPGRYADLPGRTDWGGELELELPLGPRTVLFAHWQPIHTSQNGEGWGPGWQHHIGTGVTVRF